MGYKIILIAFGLFFFAAFNATAEEGAKKVAKPDIDRFSNVSMLASDHRISLKLNDNHKNILLAEMRTLLTSIQQILFALATNNKELMISAAEHSGSKLAILTTNIKNQANKVEIPTAFEKLSASTRMQFEQLRMVASKLDIDSTEKNAENIKKITLLTSQLMTNCLACHAAFKY